MKLQFHRSRNPLVIACALALALTPACAQLPEAYTKLWNDPAVADRIEANIEKYRKGDAVVELLDVAGKPVANATLAIQQQTHEFLFGCNLFVLDQLETPELNRKYEEAFAGLFNCATVPFYWRDLEPRQGQPRFDEGSPRIWRRPPPDRLVKWCKAHGITPKGHALMYVKNMFMPDWTAREDGEALRQQGAKHMAGIARRYGQEIPIWDVANEEIPRLQNLKEWHAVPADFLPWCFQEAGRLFSKDVRLLLNDGTDEAIMKTAQYEAIIKGLLQQGVRIEGVGAQFHAYNRGAILNGTVYPPKQLLTAYERLGQLGLPLYITEITIPGTGEQGPVLQGAIVANYYRLWFSLPRMAGITWWNLGDGTAFENENKAMGGLLDKSMNPKPAYQALERLINHEWKTRLTLKTDANGKAVFRGFHGKYSIQWSVDGTKQATSFDLKSGTEPSRVTLKSP